jgi:hypothetical protein
MEAVHPVLAVIEAQFARWAGTGVGAIERDVLGTDRPRDIARIFESFCVERLGVQPARGLFYGASAGCVLGVQLEGGQRVVIKAFQRRWASSFLAEVQSAQARLAAGGLPCPRPLLAPAPIRAGRCNLAVVETFLADPGMRPGGSAAARRVSARGLAHQIALCSGLPGAAGLEQHPLRQHDGGLYGDPHSPLFDFDSTGDGAEWIDDLARHASMIRREDTSAPVVAHTDWSARNVRFDQHRLLAVYDWDSLALVTEGTAIGQAAMTWSVTADPGGTAFPDLDSVLGYISDYEEARGSPLSTGERGAAQAAAVYVLAYTARCEHALAVRGLDRPDQNAARPRLADIGAVLLQER